MAITDIVLTGYVFQDDGDALEGATVQLMEAGTNTEETSYTDGTTAAGLWTFTETDLDTTYDVRITSGTSVRRSRMWADEISLKGVDTSYLKIRGTEGAAAPLYFFADQADNAGDAWRIQASDSDTLAIGSDKASAGTIIDYITITNGADAAASVVALGGSLTVGGDLTVSGDDITMGTNTSTAILVADGTNYNPVVPSGVIDLANTGAFTLDNTVISSQTEITSGLVVADELLYSDGGVIKKIGIDNFIELAPTLATEDAIADGDYILFLDGSATGNMNKEAVHDLATLFAGAGMTATSSVVNVIGGDGITANSNDMAVTAAQTTITSVLNPSLVVGRDADNDIDFATDNKIIFRVAAADEVELVANVLEPVTSDGVALGTTSLMWSDLFLADGSVINFNAGDVTLTHSSNTLTVAGGTLAAAAITGTTIDASTDFTIGDTIITDGVITDSTGLALTANVTVTDGSYNLNIASHDGTNGLALAGTVVTATAAEINVLDGATAGTGVASKAVVLDSNGDFEFQNDDKLSFGATNQSQIYYDGTNTLWDLHAAGTGYLGLKAGDGTADFSLRFLSSGETTRIFGWDISEDDFSFGTAAQTVWVHNPAVDGGNFRVKGDHITTGYVMDIQTGGSSSITTGNILRVYGGTGSTDTRNMVYFNQAHASASGTTAVKIDQANSSALALHVDSGDSRFDGAVDIQGGYANGGGAPYDGVVDAGGGGNWTTAQAGDDDLDGGTYTMLVKQGAYSTLTVSTNNAKIVVEPASSFSGAITLSGHNITLVLGSGCAMSGLITMSGTNCSLICENGIDTIGILMSGADGYVDGGGWDTIANGGTARHAISISGADCIVENIAAITTAGGGEDYDAVNVAAGGDRAIVRNVQVTDSDDVGIYILGDDVLIEGCVILGSDSHGIVPAAPRNRILGNYLINVGAIGIATGAAGDDSVMNGNIIKDQTSEPWYIDSASENCVLVGNRGDGHTVGVDNSGTSTVASNDETAF